MDEASTEPTQDFESALQRLEEIVKILEDGQLPLDQALEIFEEGIGLSRFCHGKLEKAERRVELLLKDAAGSVNPVPFDGGADSLQGRE
jgi:exodeoxyribonuclease VII small subunit